MKYKIITVENKEAIQLPNEPFDLFGKMIINRINNEWSYHIELFDEVQSMSFPEENYDFDRIQKNGFAIGAFYKEECVGLAIFEFNWNKYVYLSDLKVKSKFRRNGVAAELIKEGQKNAEKLGYKGVYTVGQDNNLAACKFYLKQGFEIGGLNTQDYKFTKQEGKADIFFYLDNKNE